MELSSDSSVLVLRKFGKTEFFSFSFLLLLFVFVFDFLRPGFSVALKPVLKLATSSCRLG